MRCPSNETIQRVLERKIHIDSVQSAALDPIEYIISHLLQQFIVSSAGRLSILDSGRDVRRVVVLGTRKKNDVVKPLDPLT